MQRHVHPRAGAGGAQRAVDLAKRRAGGQEGGRGVNREPVPNTLQLLRAEHRRTAALDHVGHQRQVEAAPNALHFLHRLRAFDEQQVGTGPRVLLHAAQGFIQPQHGARVGTRDDQKITVVAGFHRYLDLGYHVLQRHHAPARHMAALLGKLLVFELDSASARRFVAAHRVHHVEQAAVPGIAIADQGCVGDAGELGHAVYHVGVAGQPGIGQPQVRSHRAIARHVQGFETHAVGHFCRHHLEHAGRHHQVVLAQAGLECGAAFRAAAGTDAALHAMACARSSASIIEVLRR